MFFCVRVCADRCEFDSVFRLMKKQSMNLNLLYDHDPAAFLRNVEQFVRQVPDVGDINLFLKQLEWGAFSQLLYFCI